MKKEKDSEIYVSKSVLRKRVPKKLTIAPITIITKSIKNKISINFVKIFPFLFIINSTPLQKAIIKR